MNIRNYRKTVFAILILTFLFVLLQKNKLINDYAFIICDLGLLKTFSINPVLYSANRDTVYRNNKLLILNIKPEHNNHFIVIKKNNILEEIVLVRKDTTVLYKNENILTEKTSFDGNWHLISANMAFNIVFKELNDELIDWKIFEARVIQAGFNAKIYGINNRPKNIECLGVYSTEKIPTQVFYFSNVNNRINIDCFDIARVINIGIN